MSIDDARTEVQKKQTDAATRRDTKLAQSLEKDRLVQGKMSAARPPAAPKAVASAVLLNPDNVVHKITSKRIKSKKYKPDAFIALVPGSDKKPVKKKSSYKKMAEPA